MKGGNRLAKEIIDAIREAETKAARTVENAGQEAQRILQEARREAQKLKKDMISKAQKEADEARMNAQEACQGMMEEACDREHKDGEQLRDGLEERRSRAVETVLGELM